MKETNWYYENFGSAKGPITTRELIQKIQKGELTLVSLIFREGEEKWFPVDHFKDVTDLLGKSSVKADADWVILRQLEVDGKQSFDQVGPFNAEQVLQLIETGKVKFSDYVWRAGFENWVPLGKIDEFEKPLTSSVEVDLSLYQLPKLDMISQDVPIKKFSPTDMISSEDIAPPESVGEDLAKPSWILNRKPSLNIIDEKNTPEEKINTNHIQGHEKQENLQNVASQVTETDGETQDTIVLPRAEKLQEMQRLWQKVATGLGYALVVCGVVLFSLWMKARWNKSGQNQVATVESYPEVVVSPPAETQPVVVKPPTENVVAPAPQVEVITGKANDKPVAMTDKTAVIPATEASTVVEVVKKDSELEDISKLGLKERSYFYNRDRKFLIYNSAKGVQWAAGLEATYKKQRNADSWNKEYSKWKTMVKASQPKELKRSSFKGDYMFPDVMLELKVAFQELLKRGDEMNGSLVGGRGPSRDINMADIIGRFRDLSDKAKKLNP